MAKSGIAPATVPVLHNIVRLLYSFEPGKGGAVRSKGAEPCNVTVEVAAQEVLHVRWTPGAVVAETDAEALKARAAELSSGRTLPMLVEMASMKWVDRQAAEIFSAPWPLARMALVGASLVDEVITSFYTSRHNQACPTRFFTSIDEAMTRLTEKGQ